MSPACQRWPGKSVLWRCLGTFWWIFLGNGSTECVYLSGGQPLTCSAMVPVFWCPCPIKSSPLEGEQDLWTTEYGKGDEMSRPWLCYITLVEMHMVNSCSCSPTGFIEASKHCLILLLEFLWTVFLCKLFFFLPLANNSLFKINSLFIN